MPPENDELDLDQSIDELPDQPAQSHTSPEVDSLFTSGTAAVGQAVGQIQRPNQELGILGNLGIGLNLLGALTGAREANAIGNTLLGILDRNNRIETNNYRNRVDQTQRKVFADTISTQYDFTDDDKKILPTLSVSAQAELARAKDRQRVLGAKTAQKQSEQAAFQELLKELPGNERVRLQNVYKVGGAKAALSAMAKGQKVDPALKDIGEMVNGGIDLNDESAVAKFFQDKAGAKGQALSEEALAAQVESVQGRLQKSPGFFQSLYKRASEALGRGPASPDAGVKYYVNPSAPPERRFIAIPKDKFNSANENKVVSGGYRAIDADTYRKSLQQVASERKGK